MAPDDKTAFAIYLYLGNCVVNAMPSPTGANELYLFVYRFFHLLLFNIRNVIQTSLPPGLVSTSTSTTQIEAGTPNGNSSTNVSRTTSLKVTPDS